MTPLVAALIGVGVALATLLLCWCMRLRLRYVIFGKIAPLTTAEQRRRRGPHNVLFYTKYPAGAYEFEQAVGREPRSERGYLSLRDGRLIFYQTFAPGDGAQEVKAVVILFHGYGDHCDRTTALAARTLCNSGPFATMCFDMPTHGRSDGKHVHIPSWRDFVSAAREIVQEHLKPMARRRWGTWKDLKIFGMGTSMGGGVLFSLLSDDPVLFDGVVLVCPMLYVSRDIQPPWIFRKVLSKCFVPLLPTWPVAPSRDLRHLTHEDVVFRRQLEAMEGDICYNGRARLATGLQLILAGEDMRTKVAHFNTPALILHGAGDRVTDPKVSRELFDKMKHPDKQLIMPDGVWHNDLLFGGPSKREDVQRRFKAVVTWLGDRCSKEAV